MNKAEKIKAEIERLKNVIEFSGKLRCFPYAAIFLDEVLGRLLSFIDSLEQPIKRTPADIEAAMQEVEEKSKLFTEAHKDDVVSNDTLKVISNDLEEAARKAATWHSRVEGDKFFPNDYQKFIAGAQWQKANLWKDAQSDDLPEIDREVIVLVKSLPEYEDSLLKVSFAHRPPEYWDGKNIITNEVTRYEPKRYDKGGWNQPNVKWWLDLDLPKMQE